MNCKKTTRHHAHLSLCAKSRKTNDVKSRKWPKTSIWAILFLLFRGQRFHSNWRSYLVLTSGQKPKKSLEPFLRKISVSDFGLIWRPFREYLQIKNFFQKSACDFSTFIVPNCANWENCVTNEPNNQPIIINNTDLIGPGSRRSNNNNNNNNKKIAGRWIYLSQMFLSTWNEARANS